MTDTCIIVVEYASPKIQVAVDVIPEQIAESALEIIRLCPEGQLPYIGGFITRDFAKFVNWTLTNPIYPGLDPPPDLRES